MQKNLCVFVLLGIISLFITSCQKDLYMTPQSGLTKSRTEIESIVNESKQWYDTHISVESAKLRQSFPASVKYIGSPGWKEVSFVKLSNNITEFIRYPLADYQVNIAYTDKMSPKGYRDILFRKVKGNDFILDIVEMHPDADYIEKKRLEKAIFDTNDLRLLVDNHDYTGYFLVYSKDNLLRYGERREKGQVVSRLSF